MATSSIFKDFVLEDQESANNFFEIMLAADKDKNRKSYEPTKVRRLRGKELEAWLDEKWLKK